jgi:hypothetical protein
LINQEEEIEVYPNPSNGMFMLKKENMNIDNITITDMYNQELKFSSTNYKNYFEIKVDNFTPHSMLLIKIKEHNGNEAVKKVFVR